MTRTSKTKSSTWTSADREYAGVLHESPAGDYLILTQESQLTLLKKNNRRIKDAE